MEGCIFCKIAKREISTKLVYEDEVAVAFQDIAPKAPVHVLIVPKAHIQSLNEVNDDNISLMGHMLKLIPELAVLLRINDTGYRLVVNCGQDGGQSVNHIHLHLLGGRALSWPPG